jgi:hypothetical protein
LIAQLSFWAKQSDCILFPSIDIDLFVDAFFMVLSPPRTDPERSRRPLPEARLWDGALM